MKVKDANKQDIKSGSLVRVCEDVDASKYGLRNKETYTVDDVSGDTLILCGSDAIWASRTFFVVDATVETQVRTREQSPIMKFFTYSHLPEHLQAVSKGISEVAEKMDQELNGSAEKSAGLRKLLEAKDCFVRAQLEPTNQ